MIWALANVTSHDIAVAVPLGLRYRPLPFPARDDGPCPRRRYVLKLHISAGLKERDHAPDRATVDCSYRAYPDPCPSYGVLVALRA